MKLLRIAFVIMTVSFGNIFSQWLPDVRITNDSAHSYPCFNNTKGIAADGNNVHLVWFDDRNGSTNREIYYKRSTDGGVSWGADVRLTNSAGISEVPCVAANASVVHVVWKDSRDGNEEIYYKRSSDNGLTWSVETNMSNSASFSSAPSLSVSGLFTYISWYDAIGSNIDIYCKRSTDGGVTWEANTRLTTNVSAQYTSSVSASDPYVHVIWYDTRDSYYQIYYRGSTDRGVTWGTEMRLTPNTANAIEPSVTSFGTNVYSSWKDQRDGNFEIYLKCSTDGGITWGADIRLTNTTTQSWYPSVGASGQNVHLVWSEITANIEIYYKNSTDGGLTWSSNMPITNHTLGGGQRGSFVVKDSAIHIVWLDTRDLNEEIYYKRNPTGIQAISNISSEIPNGYKLNQNYPNPFNPTTNIEFAIPRAGFVKLTVFDMLGREVETLVNENLSAGTYNVDWNAANYPSGVYFYKISTGEYSETKKMLMIK